MRRFRARKPGYVDSASDAVTRIEQRIQQVLALSRSEEDDEAEATEFSLSEVAERVWKRVSTGTTSAEIEPGIKLTGNEPRVERLLMNLFRNAIEHGGETVSVTVGELEERDGFFVEDDGPGIPAGVREKVFDWHYSTKSGGTGIGLRSVQQIIDTEGWNISITASSTGGARFEIVMEQTVGGDVT